MTGASCWGCATPDPEFAHAVAQKDDQAPYWIHNERPSYPIRIVYKTTYRCRTYFLHTRRSFLSTPDLGY
ncbi:hypothetical protein BDV41DRAFT_516981 [Aspergillus transmontanensis]|uniref:Uncharacterized protein n=1 Tax=Aspergillus transmontanensis TaxID=1034304 RepID=A0A5N6WHC0_9EURO|nr:hypothetical protein BDV41DRAFT_516981 [Aspergillus transmontanensis]